MEASVARPRGYMSPTILNPLTNVLTKQTKVLNNREGKYCVFVELFSSVKKRVLCGMCVNLVMVLLTGVLQFNTLRVPDTSASLHDVRTAQGTEEEQAIPVSLFP